MEYSDFTTDICNRRHKGLSKIRNSWGVYDAYKLIRKNKWYDIGRPVTEHEFYTIVRSINNMLAEEVANGNTIAFPSRMGKLELRKFQRGVSLVDGKLRITYPVNWEETLKLWFEDEEAKKNKTLLRNESNFVYHVRYDKYDATYENKSFYQFALNRFIKKKLKDKILKGEIDTLW